MALGLRLSLNLLTKVIAGILGPGETGFLLEDDSSFLLLEDNVSVFLLE